MKTALFSALAVVLGIMVATIDMEAEVTNNTDHLLHENVDGAWKTNNYNLKNGIVVIGQNIRSAVKNLDEFLLWYDTEKEPNGIICLSET